MTKSSFMIGLAAALLLVGSSGLRAQELVPGSAGEAGEITAERDCEVDLKKLCADVGPGQGKIQACMQKHMGELSVGCSARLSKALWLGDVCSTDIERFCPKAKYDTIVGCMRPHFGEVSDTCKSALAYIASPAAQR